MRFVGTRTNTAVGLGEDLELRQTPFTARPLELATKPLNPARPEPEYIPSQISGGERADLLRDADLKQIAGYPNELLDAFRSQSLKTELTSARALAKALVDLKSFDGSVAQNVARDAVYTILLNAQNNLNKGQRADFGQISTEISDYVGSDSGELYRLTNKAFNELDKRGGFIEGKANMWASETRRFNLNKNFGEYFSTVGSDPSLSVKLENLIFNHINLRVSDNSREGASQDRKRLAMKLRDLVAVEDRDGLAGRRRVAIVMAVAIDKVAEIAASHVSNSSLPVGQTNELTNILINELQKVADGGLNRISLFRKVQKALGQDSDVEPSLVEDSKPSNMGTDNLNVRSNLTPEPTQRENNPIESALVNTAQNDLVTYPVIETDAQPASVESRASYITDHKGTIALAAAGALVTGVAVVAAKPSSRNSIVEPIESAKNNELVMPINDLSIASFNTASVSQTVSQTAHSAGAIDMTIPDVKSTSPVAIAGIALFGTLVLSQVLRPSLANGSDQDADGSSRGGRFTRFLRNTVEQIVETGADLYKRTKTGISKLWEATKAATVKIARKAQEGYEIVKKKIQGPTFEEMCNPQIEKMVSDLGEISERYKSTLGRLLTQEGDDYQSFKPTIEGYVSSLMDPAFGWETGTRTILKGVRDSIQLSDLKPKEQFRLFAQLVEPLEHFVNECQEKDLIAVRQYSHSLRDRLKAFVHEIDPDISRPECDLIRKWASGINFNGANVDLVLLILQHEERLFEWVKASRRLINPGKNY